MAQLHYGDQEARRQVTDFDHDDEIQGERNGAQLHHKRNDPFTEEKESPVDVSDGVYGDLVGKQENAERASPPSGYGDLEGKKEERNDPFTADKDSPVDVSDGGYGDLEGKQENAERASPPSGYGDHFSVGGYGDLEGKQEDVERASPPSGYGNIEAKQEGAGKSKQELEGDSAEGEGIIDVQSLKEDYVDLSEGNTNELTEDDPSKASHAHTSQIKSPFDDPKQSYSVDDPQQESAIDDAQQEQSRACPINDDTHGCESFQGDDGKEKIKAEGYNIYSGEPENVVYNAAEVLPDRHHENEAHAARETHEDSSVQEESAPETMQDGPKQVSGSDIMENVQARDFDTKEHQEPFTEHLSSAVEQDAGFKLDREEDSASKRQNGENVPAYDKYPSAESDCTHSSGLEQDAGFKVDRDQDANERSENDKNVPATNEESPYTEFDSTADYMKAGYGGEDFVPKHNENVDKELREPREKLDQELDNGEKQEGNGERASSGDMAYGTKEENVKGLAHGKDDDDNMEVDYVEVPKRASSTQHPQAEDLAEAFSSKNNINGDDGQQDHIEEHHKKGVFERIKDKLTPHQKT